MIYPYKSMFKDHYVKITEDFIKKFISKKELPRKSTMSIVDVRSLGEDAGKVEKTIEHHSGQPQTFMTHVNGSFSAKKRDFISTSQHETLLVDLAIAHSQGDFALLGTKVSGKQK
ncbi:hypothetical protein KIN20_016461 [Parelaphostrongylus tenuis]|uniref:Uncharacterized protein n=1 Tax=Parelaphostrongylus tenuis TaxID=148309 RepID=A0AAD5MGI5_PARTN|nr:hypothetical protein KIN20_016461 [Parelaphostrongylus tenuis]